MYIFEFFWYFFLFHFTDPGYLMVKLKKVLAILNIYSQLLTYSLDHIERDFKRFKTYYIKTQDL